MAIKVALAAALVVALLALAGATSYTTTVTTTSIDEEANQQYRQCSQQVQGRQFRACQRFLSERGSPYEEEEDELVRNQGRGQYAQDCCKQLREVDRQGCGCEAIRHAVRQVQQQGGRQQSQQVYQRARDLPRICNLREQQCQFHVVFV